MEVVSLKMEESLLEDVDKSLKINRYSTRTEFIRDAIRSKLFELEKRKAIEELAKMKGSLKGKLKNLSKDELDKIAYELFDEKKKGHDIFREL
ncbi:MAG: hypothetical protein KJ583_00085 [Nanoarchaeota archaeon]|nr:hypothetical protein [Nanoarchaeota archaeon]MBU1270473.1 hypothetical protein [Nanoarchaeota archaeon]MBU1603686.1 hypothetical protein [Nanoarchaeota archaeon]MBU2443719.1 hypothetical protein [Nanoarchaeota archaeon]